MGVCTYGERTLFMPELDAIKPNSCSHPVFQTWQDQMKEILFTEDTIQKRVLEMAQKISKDYEGKQVLLVGLLNGAFMFVSDVARRLTIPYELDFMVVSSYGR